MNRQQAPKFQLIEKINIIKAKKHLIDNKIPVYTINAGTEDIIKIEFIFEAGICFQDKSLIANCTNSMLEEGTKNLTSSEIAEKIDFYGAYIETKTGYDYASISLYCINKYFEQTIEIIADILQNPIFSEKELNIYLKNRQHKYLVNEQIIDNIARRKFFNSLFGEKHPYGKHAILSDFENVITNDLKKFFNKYYTSDNCKIIIAGKVYEKHLTIINNFFGKNNTKKHLIPNKTYSIESDKNKRIYIEKPKAVQSAIQIGKTFFNILHQDYPKMQVVNTILGGYFGSRLMKNIREDKGYTYGIYSAIISLKSSGIFTIVSEVKKEAKQNVIDEIYIEIDKLKNKLVEPEELNRVKNYLLGQIQEGFIDLLLFQQLLQIFLNTI